jgi:hypothetical protein
MTTNGNFLHPLSDILFLLISTVVSGADDWETIVLFSENQLKWLKKRWVRDTLLRYPEKGVLGT